MLLNSQKALLIFVILIVFMFYSWFVDYFFHNISFSILLITTIIKFELRLLVTKIDVIINGTICQVVDKLTLNTVNYN